MDNNKKAKRGGTRPGAGRKKAEFKRICFSGYLAKPEHAAELKRLAKETGCTGRDVIDHMIQLYLDSLKQHRESK